jgi:hypothetical protein
VYLGGLPTYVASMVVFLEIHVITKESKLPPPKKPKKNYDISRKCQNIWAIQFLRAKMLKNEIGIFHHVKCLVCLCSFVKGKDMILRPKVHTLEKHAG